MKHKYIYSRYLIAFLFPIFLVLPAGLMNYLFLVNSGELYNAKTIAEKQYNRNILYGSTVNSNHYNYKFSLYKKIRPDITIVGSSRVLTFRGDFFKSSFVNMGRTVGFPLEVEKFVDDLLTQDHYPKWLLLGIDFWWGNPHMKYALNFNHHNIEGGELSPDMLLAPIKWLIKKKYTLDFYYRNLSSNTLFPDKEINRYGLTSLIWNDGYANDGSYHYTSYIFGDRRSDDIGFKDTYYRIRAGTSQFRHSNYYDEESIIVLERVINKLLSSGIRVITYLAPLPPSVLSYMEKYPDKYKYIHEFRNELSKISSNHFDFHDSMTANITDCEFIDGFHGGDIISARVLRGIMSGMDDVFRNTTNDNIIDELISNFSGLASGMDSYNYIEGDKTEVDFLNLGCQKT